MPLSKRWTPVTTYDIASFAAGQDAGARISACVARLVALQLIEDSRWWNRWRRRLMAQALLTCAEELETAADESSPQGTEREPRPEPRTWRMDAMAARSIAARAAER